MNIRYFLTLFLFKLTIFSSTARASETSKILSEENVSEIRTSIQNTKDMRPEKKQALKALVNAVELNEIHPYVGGLTYLKQNRVSSLTKDTGYYHNVLARCDEQAWNQSQVKTILRLDGGGKKLLFSKFGLREIEKSDKEFKKRKRIRHKDRGQGPKIWIFEIEKNEISVGAYVWCERGAKEKRRKKTRLFLPAKIDKRTVRIKKAPHPASSVSNEGAIPENTNMELLEELCASMSGEELPDEWDAPAVTLDDLLQTFGYDSLDALIQGERKSKELPLIMAD